MWKWVRRYGFATWIVAGGGIASAVAVTLAVLLVTTGHDPVRALQAFWAGSFGSAQTFASATMVRAIPLILTGLAVSLAFRAGVWNIGAEGQLMAGAAAATAAGLVLGTQFAALDLIVAILAGAVAGGLIAGIAGGLRARFGVLEIITTIMLNFVALHAVGYLVRGPLQEPTGVYPQSPLLPPAIRLPILIDGTRLHFGLLITLAACLGVWAALRYTEAGFRVRLVGANPEAARSSGLIDAIRTRLGVFLVSGVLAGLAGAVEVTGVTFALYESLSPGYGYTAIAVALLARLHPLGVIATGILFGALQAGGAAMQRNAGVPSVLVSIVEALLILAMVAVTAGSSKLESRRSIIESTPGRAKVAT